MISPAILAAFWSTLALAVMAYARAESPLEQHADTLVDVKAHFADPPAAFRPAPLYVWNDDMQEEEIARQLNEFKAQGIGSLFIHPRPGLITPYLSQRWLELFRFTAKEAEKRGLLLHIYDENSYPSGFAGGLVPEASPDSRLHYLREEWFAAERFGELTADADTLALFRDRGSVSEPPERFKLTVEPDGRSGRLEIDGRVAGAFTCREPLVGGVGFRSIVGRNARIDDVRFYQLDSEGRAKVFVADNFDRYQLGDAWIVENLAVTDATPPALTAGCEGGVLDLKHSGGMRDTWIRTATGVRFEGMTTVFEFRLIEISGDRSHNPALVVGTRPYAGRASQGAMLVDIRDRTPVFGPAMVDGEWRDGQVQGKLTPPDLEPIVLPQVSPGEVRQAAALGLTPGRYVRYRRVPVGSSPWYGGWWYVDLTKPGVADKFLDLTFYAYDKFCSDLYGKSVLSSFTDEPHTGTWSDALLSEFQKQHGYSLTPHLPALFADTADSMRVRHDYFKTMLSLYIRHFADRYRVSCEKRGIAFTGHVWEHEWPWPDMGPDGMLFASRQHAPGIDCLMNQYNEGPHGQFGNYRASREVSSAAHQMGRRRVLCEAYGAAGWDLTLEDMKRIGDWLLVGGVNLLDPHLSYYTIRGARKRDHPQSFSYHAPWWEAYHVSADYFGRLCWALSCGEETNRLLLLQPTTTAWMYAGVGRPERGRVEALAAAFHRFTIELGSRQIEFDLGSESLLSEIGRVEDGRLVAGKRAYDCLVLPEGLENLESSTLRLLEEWIPKGGRIISYCGVPAYVDGRPSEAVRELRRRAGYQWVEDATTREAWLNEYGTNGVRVSASQPAGGRVFHLQRRLSDGRLIFVSNCSLSESATATISGVLPGLEVWDAATGRVFSCETTPLAGNSGESRVDFDLPPAGSVLAAIPDTPSAGTSTLLSTKGWRPGKAIPPSSELAIRMESPNVLPLDYVDLQVGGERAEGLYFYQAQQRIYQAHGLDRNPWDSSAQFRDSIISKDKFPENSGFTLRYPFTLRDFSTPPALRLVVERGDRYTVRVNDHLLTPAAGEWWLDRSFRVYEIKPEHLVVGRNVIETRARPFSLFHEPEPVYLLGDFQLTSATRGWTIEPARPMTLGSWAEQGRPCYPGVVRYSRHFSLPAAATAFKLRLGDWRERSLSGSQRSIRRIPGVAALGVGHLRAGQTRRQ
ncbi:hypothetical protein HS125_08600 [bacterium]|nr:hypothetical protein [bacterium]